MGQSAGAISIATLLAMPAARGLFERAIVQSGASGLIPPTRAQATELTRGVLADLGIDEARAAEALTTLPVERLLEAQEQVSARLGVGSFTPFVDGVTVPGRPIDIVRACAGPAVPLLCGTTRDEWSLFDVFLGPQVSAIVKRQLEHALGAEAVGAIHAGYVDTDPERSPERAWVDMLGDVAFWIPMIRLAEAQAACGAPVWMYRFDWASPAAGGRLGAAHALDLPFVWNTIGHPTAQFLLGGDSEEARALASAMHEAWAAFIRTGDPGGAGLPVWPTYDGERRATLLLDRSSRVADDPGGARRSLWPV
jgi:para-nitrobenzyl esterase